MKKHNLVIPELVADGELFRVDWEGFSSQIEKHVLLPENFEEVLRDTRYKVDREYRRGITYHMSRALE
ncbi:MAG: hypothetical protein AAGM67_00375, partial [Bacteroidota bacterium]